MIRWKPLTGDEWGWGSPKNPWFVGVLMWPAIYLGISYSFYWYFIHFVGVAFGLLGVWKLAYRLTARRDLAWFAMLMLNLSGVINFDIIPYNDNYILVTFWAWIIYFFLRAVYENPAWWLLLLYLQVWRQWGNIQHYRW